MATLDQVPEEEVAVHLLLIAPTKIGKSTYAAKAALAGFTMVYFDHDNGVTALRNTLKGNTEAMQRVHYFNIENPKDFWYAFLRSTTRNPLRWNARTHSIWGPASVTAQPDDPIWIFDVTKIPASWILALDSWTSLAADALGIGAADSKAELLEGTNQGIYGEANSWLTYICNVLQKIQCHTLVQAHATRYEIYEKPKNTLGSKMKQGEMTLIETVDIPLSCSRPHGYDMGSRFNHIGWLELTPAGQTEIDFSRKPNRVGGGPPNKKAPVDSLGFDKLVGHVPAPENGDGWFRLSSPKEILEAIAVAKEADAAAKTASATSATQTAKPAAPAGNMFASIMKK